MTLTYQGFAVCDLDLFATELCLRPSHHRGFSCGCDSDRPGRKDHGRFPVELLDINPNEEVSSLKTSPKGSRVTWVGQHASVAAGFFVFLWREWVAEDIVVEKHLYTCGTWCKAV